MTPALSIFLAAPRLGGVKPRLAAEIGERQALRLYRILAARALAAVREAGLDATVWFTPPDSAAEMRFWLGEGLVLRPQASGDFGARMLVAMQAVEQGQGWLAIAADCPGFGAVLLHQACAALARGHAVLGPTLAGDYYLIGGPAPLPELFTAIAWGSGGELAETRARLERAGAQWDELPPLRAVHTAEDARSEDLLT